MPDINDIAAYIWKSAPKYGVNPALALGIAKYEGLNPNTINHPTFGNPDAKGYSFGPYQLYSGSKDPKVISGGGLAGEFAKQHGAPNADNWQQQVDFSLNHMGKNGTKDWYAVRDQGGPDAITAKGQAYAKTLGLDAPAPATPFAAPPAATMAAMQGGNVTNTASPSVQFPTMTPGILSAPQAGVFDRQYNADPSQMPFPQAAPGGLLARGVQMPASIGMGPQAGLNTAPSAYSSFTQPQVQQAVANYTAADAANADPKKKFDFAGLAAMGGQLMAAGAPKQTWTPGAPAPVHRPDLQNLFAGLLGGY